MIPCNTPGRSVARTDEADLEWESVPGSHALLSRSREAAASQKETALSSIVATSVNVEATEPP